VIRNIVLTALLTSTFLAGGGFAWAGQAPAAASDPDIPVSHRDRVYAAEQFSNTVSVIDSADNKLLGVIRLGEPSPANFSPLHRGQVLVHGLGFSPDHRTMAVVSIGSNAVTFIDTATNAVKHTTYLGRSPHEACFTPDGKEPPFNVLKTIDTGPITNHVNFVRHVVFRTDDFSKVATIPVGKLPHGLWPSGDGSRVYVGLENEDRMVAIDTMTNKVIATVPIGQAPQAVAYVPDAVPQGAGTDGLEPLGVAGQAAQFTMAPLGSTKQAKAPSSVTLFDQGLLQVLQASATGLQPKQRYVLALSERVDGSGALEPLQAFMTNPAGSAVVNAIGPIRQVVQGGSDAPRRYLTIVPGSATELGKPVQIQLP